MNDLKQERDGHGNLYLIGGPPTVISRSVPMPPHFSGQFHCDRCSDIARRDPEVFQWMIGVLLRLKTAFQAAPVPVSAKPDPRAGERLGTEDL